MVNLKTRYFNWMKKLIQNDNHSKVSSYTKLLEHLFEIDFYYSIEMDKNREADGINLRYRFEYDTEMHGLVERLIDKPCSVLEMLVALANRCEESIMDDPDIGDRLGDWFWDMINNLGLGRMTNTKYDEDYVNERIDIFLKREYEPDGTGGLFTIPNCRYDLRDVEIWYQMSWHLLEVL